MVMERWRPFKELEEIERRMEDLVRWPFIPSVRRLPTVERGWTPPIEMFEKEDKFIVRAELPGMKKEEIDVSIVGDTLTIKGERKAETEVKEENYYCCERCYGSFLRSITLPTAIDIKKVEANYQNGVLELVLPKALEVKPQKIEVSVK
jgi:HSP20 family protein